MMILIFVFVIKTSIIWLGLNSRLTSEIINLCLIVFSIRSLQRNSKTLQRNSCVPMALLWLFDHCDLCVVLENSFNWNGNHYLELYKKEASRLEIEDHSGKTQSAHDKRIFVVIHYAEDRVQTKNLSPSFWSRFPNHLCPWLVSKH